MENYKKIKIENNDSLFNILKKIKQFTLQDGLFYIEVDENSALKNYLNLKVLVSKFSGKKFVIVTSNKEIKKIGEKLGIKYFYKSDDIEFDENFSQTNVLRHNFSFGEYLRYEFKRIFLKGLFSFKKKTKKTYKNRGYGTESHIFLLMAGLILSFSLLSFIFYFAVSKTYVYITPELGVKTVSRNIVYSEKDNSNIFDSKNIIKINPISTETSLSFPFHVSSIDIKSTKNAYGVVTVYNELNTEQVFKPNTRFMADDGLVFRSSEWIKVPGTTKGGSGELIIGQSDASLVADMYDNFGKITGMRGNIGSGIVLTIPGLKFNRDKIYAKTREQLKGGLDPKIHVLTKDEYDKFVGIITEKIKAKTLEDLRTKIKNMNTAGGSNFQIVPINNIMSYSIGEIITKDGIKIDDAVDEVILNGTGRLSSFVFDKNATVFYLRSIVNESLLLGTEKLIGVSEDSLRISNILTQTTNPFYIKATTEMDYTISYNFEDSTNNLTRKLKNLIANTSKKEATSILINDTNIANVRIEFSPFWLTNVSNNIDNIEFIIQK